MTSRKTIHTDKAPKAIGPYSQAVLAGNTLYVSGQLGINPATGKLVDGGTAAQARQALENLKAILAAGGMELKDLAVVQVFLADIGEFGAVNEVYASYLGGDYPARAAFQAGNLPMGARIEILATAVP